MNKILINSNVPENTVTIKGTEEKWASETPIYPEAIKNHMAIQQGTVILFAMDATANLLYVQIAVEQSFMQAKQIAGMGLPKSKLMLSALSGPKQQLEIAKKIRQRVQKTASQRVTCDLGPKRHFSVISTEGLSALKSHADSIECDCISFYQSRLDLASPDVTDALIGLQGFAQASNKLVLIFTDQKGFDIQGLAVNYIDHLFNITNCVPDENAVAAFAVESDTVKGLLGQNSHHRSFIQTTWKEDLLKFSSAAYTGHDPETREMWKLANEGMSVTDLAEHFGKNKSNISRTLAKLPRLVKKPSLSSPLPS